MIIIITTTTTTLLKIMTGSIKRYRNAEDAFWSKWAPKLTGLTPTVKNLEKFHFLLFISLLRGVSQLFNAVSLLI